MKNVCGKNMWWLMHIFTVIFPVIMHLVYYCLVNSLNFQILLQSKELWRANEIPFNYLIYAKDKL